MCDDHILAGRGGSLHHIQSGHHRGGYALDRSVCSARDEVVDGLISPGYTDIAFYLRDHFPGGDRFTALTLCGERERGRDCSRRC